MAFFVPQFTLLMFFSISMVQGRMLTLNMSSTEDLISDGIDHVENQLVMSTCEHPYGFLPCAENTGGYVFQILVYHGLAIFGERLIGRGSKILFAITGVRKVGGILFRILMSLPPMIMMIVSGVFSSKETAQSTVSAGVGIYAGITVFSLTLQWAIYVIHGKKDLKENGTSRNNTGEPNSKCFPAEKAILFLKDSGVTVDEKTQYTAGIMLLSLIPYVVVQLDVIFNTSKRIVTLIALIVSFLSLVAYFTYQVRNPWIQQRSLEYSGAVSGAELQKLVLEIIRTGKLKVDRGFAVSQVMKVFDFDNDGIITTDEVITGWKRLEDGYIPGCTWTQSSENSDSLNYIFHELLKLFKENKQHDLFKENKQHDPHEWDELVQKILKHDVNELRDPHEWELVKQKILKHDENELLKKQVLEILDTSKLKIDQKFEVSEIMKAFDTDVSEEEFVDICKRLFLEETPLTSENIFHEKNLKKKENEHPEKDQIILKILRYAESQFLKGEPLVTPDVDQIKILFRQLDSNEDQSLSRSDLEQLLKIVNSGEIQPNDNIDIVHDLFEDLDKDNNGVIHESEFIEGVKKWVQKSIDAWKTQDKNKSKKKDDEREYNTWDLILSILWIIMGIAIMTFLGGPLMTNILQLSYAMNLPSFCVSFVMVPFATNARVALIAILPASTQKTEKAVSLTFSEIYGGVIMNNLAGMTTLLVIVIAKGLTFDFSAEVLTVLVVCGVIGSMAYGRKSYPVWTCILAFSLYPFSLALFYFVQLLLGWN